MLEFFQALVKCNLPELGFNDLLQMLLCPISNLPANNQNVLHKQAFYSLAKCVAAITVTCPNHALPVVQQFINDIQNQGAKGDSHHHMNIFALLVIGEIGREV